ncbi:transcription factor PAP1-domain-containing protein [Tuber borchii]|uniref:Transcription factor PAP1-domain-containing protein n=1 Tax=Tuber borchii TaxID=42251 RepID=A0A2T6ZIS2_TUBBO|nr:transcription factor PAP1-domain-containing protein [Tuber borchii]
MTTAAPDSLYLSPDQQDLLLAALTSNSSSSPMFNTPSLSHHISQSISSNRRSLPPQSHDTPDSMGSQYGNGTPPPTAALTGSFSDGTPLMGELDYQDWGEDLDVDNWGYDLGLSGGDADKNMDGYAGTPPSASNSGGEKDGEKRKNPPETDDGSPSADPHDAEPKRRDDKTAKKPGRKPLTSEPTSKRKAQNRAAQRAFRERKEKHLKDLEQKVADLEKASESTNHENSLLRAQVERLQIELREYRRRLHTAGQSGSPPLGGASNFLGKNSATGTGGFQFEFPLFGNGLFLRNAENNSGLKSGALFDRLNAAGGTLAASEELKKSITNTNNAFNQNQNNDLPSSLQNTPRLNGGLNYASSPSASSVSQHGPGSSAGTSPEPTNSTIEGTITTAPNGDKYICKSGSLDGETETTFCEKLSMACGNPHNPIPKAAQLNSSSSSSTTTAANTNNNTSTNTSLDWLTQQNGGNFDPVLFNDYREPVNDINSGINMSFFDDAFAIPQTFSAGLSSPLDLAQTPKKLDLLAEIDQINDADPDEEEEEVVPADDPKQMLSCNKIWDRISNHPRFVSGELDMDGLCSELRSKAKCSETGVVVAETDVQEVLTKAGVAHKDILG